MSSFPTSRREWRPSPPSSRSMPPRHKKRGDSLHETNPMLGHRGVRLGITYPEVSEMQIRAILEAAGELIKAGKKAFPEIMIPVTCAVTEIDDQKEIVDRVYEEVCAKLGLKKIPFMYRYHDRDPARGAPGRQDGRDGGVLLLRHQRPHADDASVSRATTSAASCPTTSTNKILPGDPFQTIDMDGIGELIRMGIERGRSTRPDLKVGICGEHGGDAESVKFCHRDRHELRVLFAVPRAHRAPGGCPGGGRGKACGGDQEAPAKKSAAKKAVVAKKAPAKKVVAKKQTPAKKAAKKKGKR